MGKDQVERASGYELEALHRVTEPAFQRPKQRQRSVGRGKADPGHASSADRLDEPQINGGDDPERPFRADQKLLQIVAAIVLLQRRETFEQAAVGKHRLDTLHQAAHRPEAEDLRSARIGGNEPPDGRAPPGAERQREAPAGGIRSLVAG
jgi:hypothetical protein